MLSVIILISYKYCNNATTNTVLEYNSNLKKGFISLDFLRFLFSFVGGEGDGYKYFI